MVSISCIILDLLCFLIGYSVITCLFFNNREKYLGMAEASAGLGMMLGPVLGSFIYYYLAYMLTFLVFTVILILNCIILCFALPSRMNKT
jgi:MFS family permease